MFEEQAKDSMSSWSCVVPTLSYGHSITPAQGPTLFPLMDLPPEVRLMIYQHIFESAHEDAVIHPLLRVSRDARREYTAAFSGRISMRITVDLVDIFRDHDSQVVLPKKTIGYTFSSQCTKFLCVDRRIVVNDRLPKFLASPYAWLSEHLRSIKSIYPQALLRTEYEMVCRPRFEVNVKFPEKMGPGLKRRAERAGAALEFANSQLTRWRDLTATLEKIKPIRFDGTWITNFLIDIRGPEVVRGTYKILFDD